MSKHFGVILLSLPALFWSAASVLAASQTEPEITPALSAPAHDHAAMPTGCNGCAGHDCASCPLATAAAEAQQAPAPAAEIRCGTN